MGIFSRLTDIVNSNINAILDRAEDPEKIIRLIIQEMEDTLVEVRSGAVRTIAERKEMERRLDAMRREHDEWQHRAELALTRGREDLAKGALGAKARLADAIQREEHQLRCLTTDLLALRTAAKTRASDSPTKGMDGARPLAGNAVTTGAPLTGDRPAGRRT